MLLTSVALLAALFTVSTQGTVFALGTTGHVDTSQAVQADTGCTGYGCDNTDPVQTGCDDSSAYVASSEPLYLSNQTPGVDQPVGEVDNWYSPDCSTNWAVAVLHGPNCGSECNLTARVCRPDNQTPGYYCADPFSSNSSNWVWSNQAYAPTPTCATAYGFFDNGIYSGSASARAC